MAKKRPNAASKSKQNTKHEIENSDWMERLVQQAATGGDDSATKAERIQRRTAKKEQRLLAKQQQQQPKKQKTEASRLNHHRTDKVHQLRLAALSRMVIDMTQERQLRRGRPYKVVNEQPMKKRKSTFKLSDELVQPHPSSYGGMRFARPSLWLTFDDPAYFPKLEEEFREHIPGFFGKQRTKAMKRQLDGSMLWRRMLEKKKKKNTKKNQSLDDRIQKELEEAGAM